MKKVMIVGSSGAGKSVFSRKLQKLTGIPLYHLDQMFWRANWEESDKQDFRVRVGKVSEKETWIIDGNYGSTIDVRAKEADTIIFFDYPRMLCLWRAIKRFLKGRLFQKKRQDMTDGCRERMNWQFFMWIWTYPYKGRSKALKQIEKGGFPMEKIIFFENDKDKLKFLEDLKEHFD